MKRLKGWICRPIYRTLKVDILTFFLTLFIGSFLYVMFFTYTRQKKAIDAVSLDTMQRASGNVIEKIKDLISNTLHFPLIMDTFIWDKTDISPDNPHLIEYLLQAIASDNNFSNMVVGSTEGNFIKVSNLQLSIQKTFITDLTKPLPDDAYFSLFSSENKGDTHKNSWTYFDQHFHKVGFEESSSDKYDPRSRAWYQGAVENRGIYWSDVFTYFVSGDTGISVSEPLYDKENTIIGVCGVELSFVLLSRFLAEQRVGNTGSVFLLDSKGEELVVSVGAKGRAVSLSKSAVAAAYAHHQAESLQTFEFENAGVKYLCYVDRVPLIPGKQWLVLILVPRMEFFGRLIKTEIAIASTSAIILVLASLLVFFLAKRISAPIVILAKEVDKMKRLDLSSEIRVDSHIKEIRLIDKSIAAMRIGMRSFVCYVPKRVVQQLLEKGEDIALGGDKKEITIFFSDIAGFTSFSEEHSSDEVISFLFEYFDALSKRIIQQEGIIDKYIGDSIMAFWGAPLEISDHAKKACRAALYCQAFLSDFNRRRREAGKQILLTRMTLNSGVALVGNIGTHERMNYTVMGDAINVAAQLQQISKTYRVDILLTEATYRQLDSTFLLRPLDTCTVMGKKEKIKVYELMGLQEGQQELLATKEQKQLCALFTQALKTFHKGAMGEAKALFTVVHQAFPDDIPTQIYLQKL